MKRPYLCAGTIVTVPDKENEGRVLSVSKDTAVVQFKRSYSVIPIKLIKVISYKEVE